MDLAAEVLCASGVYWLSHTDYGCARVRRQPSSYSPGGMRKGKHPCERARPAATFDKRLVYK